MKWLLLIFVFILQLENTVYSQALNRARLDSLFDVLSEKTLAMGSIAIARNGRIVYQRSVGYARMENDDTVRADKNTTYRIGSVSKMFTAVMIFQLMEEKKLSVHDSLYQYFPHLPNARLITIDNLLNHRSGLPDYTKETNFPEWMDKPKSQDDLLTLITNRNPYFKPGDQADYNNSNYLLLGYIIEKICREPYRDVLQKRIISKLGLTNTHYGSNTDSNTQACASYKYSDNQWAADKKANLNNFGGAGAIVSTPADMAKFIDALFRYKLISRRSVDKMTTLVDGYGRGLFPYAFQSKKGFGHNGKTEGFSSSLLYYPNDKLAIAYCTNGVVYPKADLLNGVLNILFDQPYVVPTFTPITLTHHALEQYVGTYASDALGLKVMCTISGTQLILTVKQQPIPFDALGDDKFMNTQYGFFCEFNPTEKQLIIKDGDDVYYLRHQAFN